MKYRVICYRADDGAKLYSVQSDTPLAGRVYHTPEQAALICDVLQFSQSPISSWGGYPLYATTQCGEVLCSKCVANSILECAPLAGTEEDGDDPVLAVEANYEDTSLICNNCYTRIACAYRDPDEHPDTK